MKKLYFYHGVVSSGKSLELIKMALNYRKRGKNVLLLTSSVDKRFGTGKITTRFGSEKSIDSCGLQEEALLIDKIPSLKMYVNQNGIDHILCDEVQFYDERHIKTLVDIVDIHDIPVTCFGLKSNFKGELFGPIGKLLVYADKIREIKTTCVACSKKATMNLRISSKGEPIYTGEEVVIGGEELHLPVCRHHYFHPVRIKNSMGLTEVDDVAMRC